jgi:hypothetical protein
MIELAVSQLTCQIIGSPFTLEPSTIWLKDDYDNRGYFPTDGIKFSGLLDAITG